MGDKINTDLNDLKLSNLDGYENETAKGQQKRVTFQNKTGKTRQTWRQNKKT